MKKTSKVPKRGEIWLVKFKKSKETPKTFRPCFVFSDDIQNEFNDLIAVAPISTENVEIIEPFGGRADHAEEIVEIARPHQLVAREAAVARWRQYLRCRARRRSIRPRTSARFVRHSRGCVAW